MSLAIVYSRACEGITAPLVTVEVHLAAGYPGLHMSGLPETAVKESKDRVRSALINSQFEFPARRITINLAPADLPKEGGRFDLPIALGILAASGQIPSNKFNELEFTGELALSGELRAVTGVLPSVLSAKEMQRSLIVPAANATEAGLVKHASVFSAQHLLEVCAYLTGMGELASCRATNNIATPINYLDLIDVRGQPHAKRALEVAAAGRHSLLFLGPPGTGKTMLASRLPSILPSLNEQEALEVAAISSVSSAGFNPATWQMLPFRSPHHSSSSVALVGGGRPPRPGEISLAHHGVLFLDELPEFSRAVLESLREPLESGQITISRAAYQAVFPAQFQFIAAMNPCPCGFWGSTVRACECRPDKIQRYFSQLSGPLLDRIDMQVEVSRVPPALLAQNNAEPGESSDTVKSRVCRARFLQHARQQTCNAHLPVKALPTHCQLTTESEKLLTQVIEKFHLSARAYHRILKVARTIADLQESPALQVEHISEALSYRCLDKLYGRQKQSTL